MINELLICVSMKVVFAAETNASTAARCGTYGGAAFVLLQSAERAAGSLAELGDGGFLSSDFELLQQVGRLSVQQVSASPTWHPK